MGLIIQRRALEAAGGLQQLLPVVRKRDRSLFDQIHRAMQALAWGRRGGDCGSVLLIIVTPTHDCGSGHQFCFLRRLRRSRYPKGGPFIPTPPPPRERLGR